MSYSPEMDRAGGLLNRNSKRRLSRRGRKVNYLIFENQVSFYYSSVQSTIPHFNRAFIDLYLRNHSLVYAEKCVYMYLLYMRR